MCETQLNLFFSPKRLCPHRTHVYGKLALLEGV